MDGLIVEQKKMDGLILRCCCLSSTCAGAYYKKMSTYQAEEEDAAYMDHVDDDMDDVDYFNGDDMPASDSDVDEFDYSVSIY